jgi:hypothetical protein
MFTALPDTSVPTRISIAHGAVVAMQQYASRDEAFADRAG